MAITSDCGHHCGIMQRGRDDTYESHCYCNDCHGKKIQQSKKINVNKNKK